MDVKQLISELKKMEQDKIVVLSDGLGWGNIERLMEKESTVYIFQEKITIFH